MPSGRGAARSKARSEAFSSCQMQIGGPTLVLRATATVENGTCHSQSVKVLTCGQRVGHVATLVPNHKGVIAIIGGVALVDVASDQKALGNYSSSTTPPSLTKMPSPVIEIANTGEVDPASDLNVNRSKISDVVLPPLETSTYPLIEYYHIASRQWSAPGITWLEKWPTQSATAVLWNFCNPESNLSDSEKLESVDEQQDLLELQSTNGDWNLARSLPGLPKIPELVCAVGGWGSQRRLASIQLYAEEAAKGSGEASSFLPGVSVLPFPESVPPISGHSCTVVGNKLYVFGGATLRGCSNTVYGLRIASSSPEWAQMCMKPDDPAGLDVAALTLVEDIASTREAAVRGSSATSLEEKTTTERIPAPTPRSAHASCCLDDRILLFFGGRRLVLGDRLNPAKRHGSNSGRLKTKSSSPGRSLTRAGGATPEEQPAGNLQLEIFNDVIAYDIESRCWLPVQLIGGAAPCPRYGASMCLLPGLSREGEGPIREILVYGGVDAAGNILSDAWILHNKKLSSGKETKMDMPKPALGAGCRTEPLQFVWVRLNLMPPPPAIVTSSSPSQNVLELSRAYHTAVVIAHQTHVREVLLVGGYVQGFVSAVSMLRLSILPINKAEEV